MNGISYVRSRLRKNPAALWGLRRIAAFFSLSGSKTYSAMIRVRNEEQYLEPCVRSIVDHVDEIVIIDNKSTDRTTEIVHELRSEYPEKIRGFSYDHDVALPGAENLQLFRSPGGQKSPRLLANYYNWCLRQCTHPFILKWDGDMVATAGFGTALDAFRTSEHQILYFFGINLFRDGRHALANYPIQDDEPRLFYRRGARYIGWDGGCEGLASPFLRSSLGYLTDHVDIPLYVHLKFCKADAFTNESADERAYSMSMNVRGETVDESVLDTVARWDLVDRSQRDPQ